jgi:hypothetical protein
VKNYQHRTASSSFLAPLPGIEEEEEAPTSTTRQQVFSGAIAGEEEEDFCEGSFRTHILYFVYCFALLYFYLHRFIKKTKKIRILGSCYFFTSSSLWFSLSTFWRTSQ